jgi:hypothetical protein
MTQETAPWAADDLSVAERVLATTFGRPVLLDLAQAPEGGSGRANLHRCVVRDGPADAPASVIVKRVAVDSEESYDPDTLTGPAARLFNEWASLEFLTAVAPGALAPRFYGGDRAAGLIVMEDLGEGESLVQPLLGDDRAKAESALDAYFRSLGRLNALTAAHAETYRRIRDSLGPREPLARPTLASEHEVLVRQLAELGEAVTITLASGVHEDLAHAAAFLADPGPFAAFSQSDACPDNCIREGDWMRFFDFEWGRFGSALNDGARARSNFPTCWCVNRLPDDIIRRTETVYRAELVNGCPAAADDTLFYREVVKACAFWALRSFEFYQSIWEADGTWGISTVRQRAIVRFELLAQATAEYGYLEALGATAGDLARRLQALWPDVAPMPYYPPFR